MIEGNVKERAWCNMMWIECVQEVEKAHGDGAREGELEELVDGGKAECIDVERVDAARVAGKIGGKKADALFAGHGGWKPHHGERAEFWAFAEKVKGGETGVMRTIIKGKISISEKLKHRQAARKNKSRQEGLECSASGGAICEEPID